MSATTPHNPGTRDPYHSNYLGQPMSLAREQSGEDAESSSNQLGLSLGPPTIATSLGKAIGARCVAMQGVKFILFTMYLNHQTWPKKGPTSLKYWVGRAANSGNCAATVVKSLTCARYSRLVFVVRWKTETAHDVTMSHGQVATRYKLRMMQRI
ncbi:hypothetical protein N7490_008815 [Penicillium lividum]|nr:hypothetical protein N7490_008815 [Penicillium lividum]